jgi:hypothetical protein
MAMRLLLSLTSLLLAANAGAAEPHITYIGKPDCLIANPHPVENETATWEGGCKDGYADGMGVLNWSVNGHPHGGYEGVLVKGVPNGPGFVLLSNDGTLQGNFKDGKLDGKGIYTNEDGDKLNATFVHGEPVGIVDFTTVDGDLYHGEWRGKHPHGQGKMTFGAGGSYEGGWADGELSGKGVITYPNGERLAREFQLPPHPAQPAEKQQYALMQERADTGTHIKHEAASGFNVPANLGYEKLTPEQQQLVKHPYRILLEGDEPPYPVNGPAAITRAFVEMQSKVLINGMFRLNVLVDGDGKPISATVLQAPDPELGKIAGSVLMLSKFKPARCAGKPCTMRYTYNTRFTLKL